jgi:Zn-dependent protease with chaperone function
MKKCIFPAGAAVFLLCVTLAAHAQQNVDLSHSQMPSVLTVPTEALPSAHFDPEAATNAYLAQIPASARARSDAYFEGGYWLILWDFLMDVAIYWVLLRFAWSAEMRDLAERLTRFKPLQTFLYWLQFSLVGFVLGAPLAIYEGYIRERKYGLATQTFAPWFGEQLKGLLIGIILGGIIAMALVGVVRRWPRSWHVRCAVVSMVFAILFVMIVPVVIVPVFNTAKRLEDPKITAPILSLARANGIPAHDVYEIDASKQSTRMSANVSGFGKTMRITMNDNLLKRGSPEEIQEVMGHEMGHYVLNHIPKDLLFFFVVITVFFALLRWTLDWSLARWGEHWHLRGFQDVAAIPLVFLLGSIYFFLLTPILNTHTRTSELEADMYGLNASRQPDGAAQGAIHLGEYRKMSPGPIEEWLFYDHPSGRTRIYNAMRWKAENLQLFQNQSTH